MHLDVTSLTMKLQNTNTVMRTYQADQYITINNA